MGSDETASTISGGPRVIDIFYGDGCHRVQIIYCFRMQIGPRTRSGIGLGSGGPLDSMRRCSVLPRELWIEIFGKSWSRATERKGPCLYVCTDGSRRACGVGACARLVATLGAPRETSGPRIDRIPPARPSWRDRQYRELKKYFFRPSVSVPLISLDHERTERYSYDCMALAFAESRTGQGLAAAPPRGRAL